MEGRWNTGGGGREGGRERGGGEWEVGTKDR